MTNAKKSILGLIVLTIILLILFNVKSSEKVNAVVQYQMLACEKCDHFKVIQSNKKELTGELVVFVSSKEILTNIVNFSLEQPNKTICARGKLYLLDLSFDFINPKGRRLYLEDFADESKCS